MSEPEAVEIDTIEIRGSNVSGADWSSRPGETTKKERKVSKLVK